MTEVPWENSGVEDKTGKAGWSCGLQWWELGCFLQLVGRCGWFRSRAVFHVSWKTSFSCSSDVKAIRSPNDGCPRHVCMWSHVQEHTRYQGEFSIPITLRLSPRKLESLAATSEWGTSWAVMVGCWQALVTSRLSGCSLVWKSLMWVQRCWGCSDGEERGQEAACVQREEKDSFLKLLSGLSPGKWQSGTWAEVASAFSLLLLTPVNWIPTSFLCLVFYFLDFASSYLLEWADMWLRGNREKSDGRCIWNGIWFLGGAVPSTPTRAQWDESWWPSWLELANWQPCRLLEGGFGLAPECIFFSI